MILSVSSPESFRKNTTGIFASKIVDERQRINLEKGVFNYSLRESERMKIAKKWNNPLFVRIYVERLRTVYFNLNSHWAAEINSGNIESHEFACMTHPEMDHEHWKQLIERKALRDKNRFETNLESATDTFTCRKCKQSKCAYYQMMTRSADEPMTTFVSCIPCGNRWKC
jgi:transcription elongation factor S-II